MKRYDYGHLHLVGLITSTWMTERLLEHNVAESKYFELNCYSTSVLLRLKTEFWHYNFNAVFIEGKVRKLFA